MRFLALEKRKADISVILMRHGKKNYCVDDIILDSSGC